MIASARKPVRSPTILVRVLVSPAVPVVNWESKRAYVAELTVLWVLLEIRLG